MVLIRRGDGHKGTGLHKGSAAGEAVIWGLAGGGCNWQTGRRTLGIMGDTEDRTCTGSPGQVERQGTCQVPLGATGREGLAER